MKRTIMSLFLVVSLVSVGFIAGKNKTIQKYWNSSIENVQTWVKKQGLMERAKRLAKLAKQKVSSVNKPKKKTLSKKRTLSSVKRAPRTLDEHVKSLDLTEKSYCFTVAHSKTDVRQICQGNMKMRNQIHLAHKKIFETKRKRDKLRRR